MRLNAAPARTQSAAETGRAPDRFCCTSLFCSAAGACLPVSSDCASSATKTVHRPRYGAYRSAAYTGGSQHGHPAGASSIPAEAVEYRHDATVRDIGVEGRHSHPGSGFRKRPGQLLPAPGSNNACQSGRSLLWASEGRHIDRHGHVGAHPNDRQELATLELSARQLR